MKITIIAVGKVKEKYLQLGIAEFSKRLSRFCKLEFIEVKDESLTDITTAMDVERVRQKEGKLILKKILTTAHIVALDIAGKQLTSQQLAEKLGEVGTSGTSHVIFIIGGSVGLCNKVKNTADMNLSFSKMTFPHQLSKLMLLEQLFRVFKIIANEPYHK